QPAGFRAGQGAQLPVPAAPPARPVQRQLTAAQQRRRRRRPAAERVDPRDQFRKVERLGQVVIRAQVQPADPVIGRTGRGQHQDPGTTRPAGPPPAPTLPPPPPPTTAPPPPPTR